MRSACSAPLFAAVHIGLLFFETPSIRTLLKSISVTNYGSFHFEIQGHRAYHIHAVDKLRDAKPHRAAGFEQTCFSALAGSNDAVDAGEENRHDIRHDDRKGNEPSKNDRGEHRSGNE